MLVYMNICCARLLHAWFDRYLSAISSDTISHEKSHPASSRNPASRKKKNPVPAFIPQRHQNFIPRDPVPYPAGSRSRPASRKLAWFLLLKLHYDQCDGNIIAKWRYNCMCLQVFDSWYDILQFVSDNCDLIDELKKKKWSNCKWNVLKSCKHKSYKTNQW